MALRKRKSISVKAAKKNCFEQIVPIPNEFYASNKEEDLILPKRIAVPMALVLQFMQWGAFASFFAYYSMPISYIRESTIQAEWNYGGPSWNCTPMTADDFYSMRWNYETCKTIVQPPNEKSVLHASDQTFMPADFGEFDSGFDIPTRGDAWRYYPFIGTPAFAKGVMGPALPLISNPSLDHDGVKTAIDGIFSQLVDLNTCGLDGFPQHIYRMRNDIVKHDRYIYDIFQVNLKQSLVPPPPSPPPMPPFPSPPSTQQSICCGGGTTYDVEESKCQSGTFMFNGNPGTRCSNFQYGASVGEFIEEYDHNTAPPTLKSSVLHTARLQDEKYYSVTDIAGDRTNKVDLKKLNERGHYHTGQNDECADSGNVCTFLPWSDQGNADCICSDGASGSATTFGERVENCAKCCIDDAETCGYDDPTKCNPDLCCYDCSATGDFSDMFFGHGSSSSSPPTKEDPQYASEAYGLPAGFYENCTTTQAEAIAMFTKYNELHDPCEWAKFNGPFTCERAGPTGIGQRFSLAYANALLAYTVISATIVNIFYAKAKRRAEGKDVEEGVKEVESVDVGPRPTQPTTQIQFADGTTLTQEQIQAKV